MSTIFFPGDAQEVIRRSKAESKPLVVFLKGKNLASAAIEAELESSALFDVLSGCYVFRLEDDLEDHDSQEHKTARLFRQHFPTDKLPTIMLMGVTGHPLMVLKGEISGQQLNSQLQEAVAAFHRQEASHKNPKSAPQQVSPSHHAQKPGTSGAEGTQGETDQCAAAKLPRENVGISAEPVKVANARADNFYAVNRSDGVPGVPSTQVRSRGCGTFAAPHQGELPNCGVGHQVCLSSVVNEQQDVVMLHAEGSRPVSAKIEEAEGKTEGRLKCHNSGGSTQQAIEERSSACRAKIGTLVCAVKDGPDFQEPVDRTCLEDVDGKDAVKVPRPRVQADKIEEASKKTKANNVKAIDGNRAATNDVLERHEDATTVKEPERTQNLHHTSAFLRFRLINGDSLDHEFSADATLGEVRQYVDVHRTDGRVPYNFGTLYPMQTFNSEHNGMTLEELDLVPRSTVLLQPILKQSPATRNTTAVQAPGVLLSLWGGIGLLITVLWAFFWSNGEKPEEEDPHVKQHHDVKDTTAIQVAWVLLSLLGVAWFLMTMLWAFFWPSAQNQEKRVDESTSKATDTKPIKGKGQHLEQDPGRVVHRKGYGPNVHGLSDTPDADPTNNAYWNGNSTQYGGGEDD